MSWCRGVESGDLNDEQWQRLVPLLPAQKPPTVRPGKDHRTIINGILWVLRTGAPHIEYGAGSGGTCRNDMVRGAPRPAGSIAGGRGGLWERLLAEVQREADVASELEWEVHFVDGTSVRAISTLPEQKWGGRSGVGPIPGQRHEAGVFEELMPQGAVKRSGGRPSPDKA